MNITRRSIIAAAATSLVNTALGASRRVSKRPGSGGGGVVISTFTLVNDSAGTQAAGVPTQSFGCIFNKGDIPSGQAPQFQIAGGVVQPFSASVPSMRRFYSDGSLLFAIFSLVPTVAVAGNGTLSITVLNGGTWPSPSARTLTDINAANLAVSFPAAAPSGANITGTWGAWCDTVGNSNNLINSGGMKPVADLDGDAGKRWRIDFNMSQTKNGMAHGQMVFTFYVWALNNSSGNLGGFRWSGYSRQPWYNLSGEGSSVPAKNFRVFDGPSWSATGVASTPMSFKGSDGNVILPGTFTVVNDNLRQSGGMANQPNNNYWLGGPDGTVIPVYFTTTGTLPLPLNINTVYFALVFASASGTLSYPNLSIYGSTRCAGGDYLSLSGGSGTHTVHPVTCLAQFCKLGFKNDNGRYLFFQGAGSIAAETTLRAQIDRTYWQKTGLIEPHDLTQKSIPNGGIVTETQFNNLWNPHTIASCEQDQDGATGVVQNIGWFPNDCGLDFYNQSARSEQTARCYASAQSGIPFDFLDANQNSRVNLSSTTYTGLPASIATTVSWGDFTGGFTTPPTQGWGMGFTSVGSPEHQAHYAGWALLRFGEPDYFDFVKDLALGNILGNTGAFRNTDFPVVGRKGVPLGFGQEYRSIAWIVRAMQFGATFCPFDTNTGLDLDGTQTSQQIRDLDALSWQQHHDAMTLANNYFGAATSYMIGRGLWAPFCDQPGSEHNHFLTSSPEWEFAYVVFSACVAAVLGNTNAQNFLTTVATRYEYVRTHFTLWDIPAYYTTWGVIVAGGPVPHTGPTCFSRDQDWNVQQNYTSLTWVPGSTAAFTASSFSNSQTPANGDTIIFYALFQSVPGGLSDMTGYFLVNVASIGGGAFTFGVSNTNGGPAIAITNSGSALNAITPGITSHNASMTTSFSNLNSPFAMALDGCYPIIQAARWIKAALSKLGLYTNQLDAVLTDFNFRLNNSSDITFLANPYTPANLLKTAPGSPAGALTDVRYAVADHFG